MSTTSAYFEYGAFSKKLDEIMGTILSAEPEVAKRIKETRISQEFLPGRVNKVLCDNAAYTVGQALSIGHEKYFPVYGVGPVAREKLLEELRRACEAEGLSVMVTADDFDTRKFYFQWLREEDALGKGLVKETAEQARVI